MAALTHARQALDNALQVEDAYREQYQAARTRYTNAAGSARTTAHTLLRHAADQLRAARIAAEKAANQLHQLENPNTQAELTL